MQTRWMIPVLFVGVVACLPQEAEETGTGNEPGDADHGTSSSGSTLSGRSVSDATSFGTTTSGSLDSSHPPSTQAYRIAWQFTLLGEFTFGNFNSAIQRTENVIDLGYDFKEVELFVEGDRFCQADKCTGCYGEPYHYERLGRADFAMSGDGGGISLSSVDLELTSSQDIRRRVLVDGTHLRVSFEEIFTLSDIGINPRCSGTRTYRVVGIRERIIQETTPIQGYRFVELTRTSGSSWYHADDYQEVVLYGDRPTDHQSCVLSPGYSVDGSAELGDLGGVTRLSDGVARVRVDAPYMKWGGCGVQRVFGVVATELEP